MSGDLEEGLAGAGAVLLEVRPLAVGQLPAEDPLRADRLAAVLGGQHLAVAEEPPLAQDLLHEAADAVPLADVHVEVDVPGEDVRESHGDGGVLLRGDGGVVERARDLELDARDLGLHLHLALAGDVLVAVPADLPLVHRALPVVEVVQLAVPEDEPELVSDPGLPEVEHALERGDDPVGLSTVEPRRTERGGEHLIPLDAAVQDASLV